MINREIISRFKEHYVVLGKTFPPLPQHPPVGSESTFPSLLTLYSPVVSS